MHTGEPLGTWHLKYKSPFGKLGFSVTFKQLKTYRKRKREYPALFAQPEHQHLKIIRFQHPRKTKEWMTELEFSQPDDEARQAQDCQQHQPHRDFKR